MVKPDEKDRLKEGSKVVRPVKDLASRIEEANRQRVRELSDFIVNRLPLLPEELDELRNLINDMSVDEAKQRAACMNRFKDIEALIDRKISELKLDQVRELEKMRTDLVRETTTSLVQSINVKEVIKAENMAEKNSTAKTLKWMGWAIFGCYAVVLLQYLYATPYFKPVMAFLLSIVKVVF